jgi:hypothetical protein
MNPQEQFCHNLACADRGQSGRGNICIHSRKEQRYRCSTCGRPLAATISTPFYRVRTATDVVTLVLTCFATGILSRPLGRRLGLMSVPCESGRHVQGSTANTSTGILSNRARWISATCRPLYRRPAYDVC